MIKKLLELKKLNFIGMIVSYLFILSPFINSKLNMKIGYVLVGLGVIKLALYYKEEKPIFNKKIWSIFSIFLLLGLINNIFISKNNGVSAFLSENVEFFYVFFLGIFLTNKEKLERCNYIFMVGTVLLFYGGIYHRNEYFLNSSYSRQRGILIISSAYFMIDFFENILKHNFRLRSGLNFLTLILSIYMLVKLNSRMAVFCVVLTTCAYFIYLLLIKKEKKVFILIVVALLIGGISYNFLPDRYIARLKTSFHTENNISNEDRIIMWKAGVEIYKNNPILGVGASANDVKPLLMDYVDKNVEKKVLRDEFLKYKKFSRLHNMYLDFVVQSGILGMGYIILLLLLIPYEFYKSSKEGIKVPLFFSLVSFYIYGVTWSLWSDYHIVQVLFNVILMLMMIDIEIGKEKKC